MRMKVCLWSLAFLVSCAFDVPAGAMNIAGTEYAIFAKTNLKMEDGPLVITGDVAVNDPGGLLRIGAAGKIFGTASAAKTFFGTSSTVIDCEFNSSTGGSPGAVCGSQAPAVVLVSAWPPAPVPPVPVNNKNQICPVNGTLTLAPGTYGELDVRDKCRLTLSAGTYAFKKVRLQTGARVDGNGATVNVKGAIASEPTVTINDATMVSVNAGTFETIIIGNNSILNNVVLYAPNARMHLRQGGVYTNVQAVGLFITVEPITMIRPAATCAPSEAATLPSEVGSFRAAAGMVCAVHPH